MLTPWLLVIVPRFRLARGACGEQVLHAFCYLWRRLACLCALFPMFELLHWWCHVRHSGFRAHFTCVSVPRMSGGVNLVSLWLSVPSRIRVSSACAGRSLIRRWQWIHVPASGYGVFQRAPCIQQSRRDCLARGVQENWMFGVFSAYDSTMGRCSHVSLRKPGHGSRRSHLERGHYSTASCF